MTFDQLQAANATIKTEPIKGKEYANVNERIRAFRMLYPEGFIHTYLVEDIDGKCTMRAEAGYYEGGSPVVLGTGTAFEVQNSSYINKTSYIENCETSAVGRALGMCGFGINTSVCSADELANALISQNGQKKIENDGYKPTEEDMPDAVKCPICGNPVIKYRYKGEAMTPESILERFGMCVPCYKEMEARKNAQ